VVAYRHHYGESGLLGSEPYPGISGALQEMRRAGLRIYLASSKREVFARRILENLKLATYFDGIYGSVPSGKLDHKPELLAHILSEQDICASHSLMVGIAGMTSSGLTRSICAVLASFGDMVAEMSLKRLAQTN
jgi:phosphoglycolate phosphatase